VVRVDRQHFAVPAEEIAKRVATYQNGNPTTIIGPPTAGPRVQGEFWRDTLLGEWVCTVAGTPGTWKQIRPAPVTADPTSGTIPTVHTISEPPTSAQLQFREDCPVTAIRQHCGARI
jgi:hypothetical protein